MRGPLRLLGGIFSAVCVILAPTVPPPAPHPVRPLPPVHQWVPSPTYAPHAAAAPRCDGAAPSSRHPPHSSNVSRFPPCTALRLSLKLFVCSPRSPRRPPLPSHLFWCSSFHLCPGSPRRCLPPPWRDPFHLFSATAHFFASPLRHHHSRHLTAPSLRVKREVLSKEIFFRFNEI